MKKKRINYIFNLAYKAPFFYELLDELSNEGNQVILYDLISSKKYFPQSREIVSFNPFFGAKFILRIRYLRRLFIPLINELTIKKEFTKNDIVNIHYVHLDYVKYAKLLNKYSSKLIVTFWGSDILRANKKTLKKYIPLLTESESISMVEGIQNTFREIYPQFSNKIRTSYFGLKNLDKIKLIDDILIKNFKLRYGINENHIYVTIGYNASPSQQHIKLLEILNNLSFELKSKLYLLIPMTYGCDNNYKDRIKQNLKKFGIEYTIFNDYLSEEDLSILRVLSNVTLNIQVTDAFSASISESIMANNIVLVGDWLPYDIYNEWGIVLFQSSFNEYGNVLRDILYNYDKYLKKIEGNSKLIYTKLSIKDTIQVWNQLY